MLLANKQSDAPLEDPTVVGVLDNVEGGQLNLLAVSALDKDVRVEAPQWHNSEPSEENPEYLEVEINGVSIERKKFTSHPIQATERYINVSPDKFREGRNTVLYKVTSYTGDEYESLPYTVTVDITSPELAFNSEPLIDPRIIEDGLSAQYLEDNDGKVPVNLPGYMEPAPGDKIVLEYRNENSAEVRELTKELTNNDYYDPIQFVINEVLIREMGDGPRSFRYIVYDRAGNRSEESKAVTFVVAVLRAPHFAPHPWVLQATGAPAEYAELDPIKAVSGATGKIPDNAIYYDDDKVAWQFGVLDAVGSIRISVPWPLKEVTIPAAKIAANFNRLVPIHYELELPDTSTKKSVELNLQILSIAQSRFVTPQLEPPFTDPVSKAAIPAEGVPVLQGPFVFISEECLITITVSGLSLQGGAVSHTVLDRWPVTSEQVANGVHVKLPKAFMSSLAINERFDVITKVSFDKGARWTTFIPLSPLLRG